MFDLAALAVLAPFILATAIYVLLKRAFFWWLEKNGFVRNKEETRREAWPYADPRGKRHR